MKILSDLQLGWFLSGLFESMVDSVCIGVHTRKKYINFQGNIGLNGRK